MFCGKCGAKIPDGYEFCMECGTKMDVSQKLSAEADAAEPKTEKRVINKKVFISVIAAILMVAVIVVGISVKKGMSEKKGYFANIPWGTDIDTVQRKLDKTFKTKSTINEDKDSVIISVENYGGMQGVTASAVLYCEDNATLNKVSILFFIDEDSKYTNDDVADELIEKYNKLFGNADNDTGYKYEWTTKNSTIEFVDFGVIGYDRALMLNFKK